MKTATATCACGHIACVCATLAQHHPKCRYAIAMRSPVGIECIHGFDVCPNCDPCTCESLGFAPALAAPTPAQPEDAR